MVRRYYVYIVASKTRVIYVGMTGFLMARVLRHRAGEGGEFTRQYRVHRLVYYEVKGREHAPQTDAAVSERCVPNLLREM